MSLQVWLPLNGNLDNQGLSNLTATNGGAVISTQGKIGSCYTFTNKVITLSPNAAFKSQFSTEATLACWVKISTSHNSYAQIMTYGTVGTSWNNIIFGIDVNGSGIPIGNISNGSNYSNASFSTAIKDNVWHHLAFVYKSGTMTCYMDGVLKNTYTTSYIPAFNSCTVFSIGGNSSELFKNGDSMNDIRLYNHALSAKEVAEIAKGLVLHYPLNENGGQENLLSRYVSPGQQAPTATATAGRTNYYGDYGIIIPATENADTYFRLFLNQQLTANEVYTISCNVSGLLSGSYYNFPLFAQGNTSMGVLQLNHNGLCSLTFTMTYGTQTAVTTGSETVYICFMDDSGRAIASGQGPITVTNFKIEKGSVATPWIPASTDSLYSAMGFNNTTIFDVSGYKYNGTKNGTFNVSSDTPRYSTSTKCSGSNYFYLTSPCAEIKTVSLWVNWDTIPSGQSVIFVDNKSHLGFGLYSGGILCATSGIGNSSAFNKSSLVANTWYHFVIINPGDTSNLTRKLYINGVEQSTNSNSSYWSYGIDQLQIGKRSNTSDGFVGKISDFRAYSTALTAEQVKELYNVGASITNTGTLMAYEFIES